MGREMKRIINAVFIVVASLMAGMLPALAQATPANLEQGFEQPPDLAKPWVYWTWLGGNISREGITTDLEAMKRVGIGGAVILDLGALSRDPVTKDPVLFMTPKWREMMHHALAEAARLGLQIDLNNDDGWNCGGPWITPELSMQTLTWSETLVRGPGKFSGTLSQPPTTLDTYRNIAVLAIPALAPEKLPDVVRSCSQSAGKWVELAYAQPVTVRAVTVTEPAPSRRNWGRLLRCELQVSDDGKTFRRVRVFETGWRGIFRSATRNQWSVTVGFEAVTGRFFRLFLLDTVGKPEVDFTLQAGGRVSHWRLKGVYDSIAEHGGGSPLFTLAGDYPASAPRACIPPDKVLNLTDRMKKNGEIEWDVPAGEWRILRIGYTPTGNRNGFTTPAGSGLDCDKLNAHALDVQFAGMVDKIIAEAGPLAGKSLTMIHDDSLEDNPQNWTAGFTKKFQMRRGYNLIPWLPVLAGGRIVGNLEESERFLWDVRRTLADLMIANYFKHFQELCHARGMVFTGENTGRQQFLYDPVSFDAACDVPMGEFWPRELRPRPDCKAAASAAHVYGMPIVRGESFTLGAGGRWMDTPFTLKAFGDSAFCFGVNQMVFHRMVLERWPDRKPGLVWPNVGVNFDSSQTWWDQGRAWIEYLSRCQYLLQQGRFVADVAVLTGEGVPDSLIRLEAPVNPKGRVDASTFTEAMLRRFNQMPVLPPVGYDYDGVDPKAVQQMTVENGRLVLPDGMSYRLLALPPEEWITPALARKVRQLVEAGAVVVGPKPKGSPSLTDFPHCDAEVQAIARQAWGDCDGQKVTAHKFGKGEIYWGRSPGEIFHELGLPPDFEWVCGDFRAHLQFIHRRVGHTDIYFVCSQEPCSVDATCAFRVSGKAPELWFPDSGQIIKTAVYKHTQGRTVVPLHLDPFGSLFVVFHGPASQPPILSVRRNGQTIVSTVLKAAPEETLKVAAYPKTASAYAYAYAGVPGPGWEKTAAADRSLFKTTHDDIALSFAGQNDLEATVWEDGHYELQPAQGDPIKLDVEQVPAPLTLEGPWELHFPAGWGAPDKVTLDSLISWSRDPDPGVKHFSGTATYRKKFEVPSNMLQPGREIILDLGRVRDFAEVRVNGQKCGYVLWKPPFRVNITGAVRAGPNALEIKVTNLWPNRLIGDAALPEKERLTWVNWNPYKPDSPLLESGLLGPVELDCAVKLNLKE